MKKVSKEQIDYLFDYTRKKRVRYYEIQLELVDHLASAIEGKWEQQPELSFEKALQQVYDGFGIYGFAKIVQEKEQAFIRYWRNKALGILKEQLLFPMVLRTVSLTMLIFSALLFSESPRWITISLLAVMFGMAIISVAHNLMNRKKLQKYLSISTGFGLGGAFMSVFFSSFQYLPSLVIKYGVQHPALLFGFAVFMCFSLMLCYVLFIRIPQLAILEVEQKYHFA